MTWLVQFTPEAESQARIASDWWEANRPRARELFAQELSAALDLLSANPEAGLNYPTPEGTYRRLLMRRTRFHVYYELDDSTGQVWVVSVWGAVRGRRPLLR